MGHAVGDHIMYALGFGGGAALCTCCCSDRTHLRAQFSPTVLPILARVAGGVLLLCAGADLYRGDDDGMVTSAGMVNGLHIRISLPTWKIPQLG